MNVEDQAKAKLSDVGAQAQAVKQELRADVTESPIRSVFIGIAIGIVIVIALFFIV